MGIGSIIFSLAAVIIGEAILRHRSMFVKVLGVILGSIIFRLAVAMALHFGMNPNDLKLITAFFVLVTLIASGVLGSGSTGWLKYVQNQYSSNRKAFLIVFMLALCSMWAVVYFSHYAPAFFYFGFALCKLHKFNILIF